VEHVAALAAWIFDQSPPTVAGFLGGMLAVVVWTGIASRRKTGKCAFCNGKLESNCRHVIANGAIEGQPLR
jgi:hypothetical protein